MVCMADGITVGSGDRMKVVAHPLVVAAALGLLGPMALAAEESPEVPAPREAQEDECADDEPLAAEADDLSLPHTVFLGLD